MKQVKRSALVSATPEQLFALINDVEQYPAFLPGCTAAAVLSREGSEVVASLQLRRSLFSGQFTTRNRLQPPHEVHMTLVDGPFRSLVGRWTITPIVAPAIPGQSDGATPPVLGSRVDLVVEFELAGGLATLLGPVLEPSVAAVVDAFVRRAEARG